jgi:hypothetical protein
MAALSIVLLVLFGLCGALVVLLGVTESEHFTPWGTRAAWGGALALPLSAVCYWASGLP